MRRLLLVLALVLLSAGLSRGVSLEEFKALKAKAVKGDSAVQVELGDLYFAESLQLYTKAAEQGNAMAQYVLGCMYYNETNFTIDFAPKHYFGAGKEDKAAARGWYEKAAAQELVEARVMLGNMALSNEPESWQVEEAVKWLTPAAEQGSVDAQRALGLMYNHLPRSYRSAEMLRWLTIAAENGDVISQMELAKVYLGQSDVPHDYALALQWFTTAAEQGEALALWELAKMYSSGNGVEADKVKALFLMKQAADDTKIALTISSDAGMRMILDNLEQSLTMDEQDEAQKLYDKAVQTKTAAERGRIVTKTITVPVNVEELALKVKSGNAEARFKLAEYYANEGLNWYQKAANNNNAEAQRKLGIIYNGESVIAPNELKALGWFSLGAENGDVISQRALGLHAAAGYPSTMNDSAAAVKWLTLAAEQGDVEAQYWLSILYRGEGDITANNELVLKWETAAALQGHPYAQYRLGEYYSRQKNYDEASKWFASAAEHDIPSIQYDVAHKYYVGKEGLAQDFSKAFQLFLKAAQAVSAGGDANNPLNSEYYYIVGDFYYNGQGTRQNYGEALKWFTRAANLGTGKAAYRIAEMHKNGQGVRKSTQSAIEWFAKAHDNYNKDAAYMIAQIYVKGDGIKPDMDEAQKWFVAAVRSGNEDALQWFSDNPGKVGIRWLTELERTLSVHERDRENLALVKNLMYDMAEKGNHEALQRIFALAGSGSVKARYMLASMYLTGEPLPQSYINAWVWGRLAMDQNAKNTEKAFSDELKLLMNAANANMTDFEQSAAREDWRLLKQDFKRN